MASCISPLHLSEWQISKLSITYEMLREYAPVITVALRSNRDVELNLVVSVVRSCLTHIPFDARWAQHHPRITEIESVSSRHEANVDCSRLNAYFTWNQGNNNRLSYIISHSHSSCKKIMMLQHLRRRGDRGKERMGKKLWDTAEIRNTFSFTNICLLSSVRCGTAQNLCERWSTRELKMQHVIYA